MCVVVTVDITLLNLCRGRFEYLTKRGFDISAVCAPTAHADEIESRGVRLFTAPLNRAITPIRDIVAIWRLFRLFRREKFDIVEFSTPKASLVGSIAARLAGVPHTVHLLRGLVYQGQRGVQRWLLKLSQTIPCRLAHNVISVSQSMMEQAITDSTCSAGKIRILGSGSSNGVDIERFASANSAERSQLRQSLGIPPQATVAGFVGRMTGDKGIGELIRAFTEVAGQRPDLFLLLIGDYEHRDRPPKEIIDLISTHPRIRHAGWQEDTVPYFRAMDFLAFPTYREGFPTVLLEAAAMGLPIITTDITGCRDAVEAGETAIVIPSRDTPALVQAIRRMADDVTLREQLGSAGRCRVESSFAQEDVWRRQKDAFRSFIAR